MFLEHVPGSTLLFQCSPLSRRLCTEAQPAAAQPEAEISVLTPEPKAVYLFSYPTTDD